MYHEMNVKMDQGTQNYTRKIPTTEYFTQNMLL